VYKIFGLEPDWRFGRVAKVEFSTPVSGGYAYLLGNFNAFNEGSFRMRKLGNRWRVTLKLPEGVWYYAFSVNGEFTLDGENPEKTVYRRLSYKFERPVSVARILGPGRVFHRPSATYLYAVGGRTHFLLRVRGEARRATLSVNGEYVKMRRMASDGTFEYYGATLSGDGRIKYSFIVELKEHTVELGPFEAEPYRADAPEWVYGSVFYEIMPDRFEGSHSNAPAGEGFHGGDLEGIIRRLDHVQNVGFNAIYLTPIFESTTYHRYDVTDYFHVDRKLGGDEAFRRLVRELKKREIRLVLDGVFHHTSFFHPFFQDVVKREAESEYVDFYRITGLPVVSEKFLEILNRETPTKARLREVGWNYESFYSVWLMPRLNHDNPRVRELIGEVMRHWLDAADGWRLDVAHGVPPDLWREVRRTLPRGTYLIGEVMDDARLWLFDVFHGTMNYPLYELILRFFVEREIDAGEFLNGLELLSAHYGPAEYLMYNFLDNHDTERFVDLVGDEGKYLCALAFLMTYKGIPSIFYGDEVGLRGSPGGGLDAGRTPMEWNPRKWDMKILETTRKLVMLRRRSKALQLGMFVPLKFEGDEIIYERVLGNERVLVKIRYPRDGRCSFKVRASGGARPLIEV